MRPLADLPAVPRVRGARVWEKDGATGRPSGRPSKTTGSWCRPRGSALGAVLLAAALAFACPAFAKPVGCPVKGTGKGTDGLSRMQVEVADGMPGSTIVCHYYDGKNIILQNGAACKLEPITRSETSRKTKIDICEAIQPTDIAQCTAQCGP